MKIKLFQIFAFMGLVLIGATYYATIWSVALQSIQYPKAMYPKGIRINFKYNGVYNGCKGVREREELAMDAGADCLLEMNKINHFIGMFPIVQGINDVDEIGEHVPYPVYAGESIPDNEIPGALKFLDKLMRYSPYLFIVFGLLVIWFMVTSKKKLILAAIIPALVPFYFLFVYIYYLYWYGHHLALHGGGAFAGIKPFMPTVFGEGKVAQFTTESYPYYGFFIALGVFVFMILAILLKNKELKKAKA